MRTHSNLRALLVTVAVAICGAPKPAFAEAISEEAKQHFRAGVAFLEDPDGAKVEEAYREFKQAYEMSKSPKVLGNLGICAMKLERDGEAIDALASYLREVDDLSEAERKQVTRDLHTLRTSAVRLGLSFSGAPKAADISIIDVRVAIRGEKITNTYKTLGEPLEISVRPGHHVITARVPGASEVQWELDAAGGGKDAHTFEFKANVVKPVDGTIAAPTPHKPAVQAAKPSIAPWVVVGAGGAVVAAGTVTGIVALSKTNAIANECPNNLCPGGFELNAARSGARKWVTATDVLLISGTAVAAGGFVWWLLSRNKAEQAPPPPAMVGCGPQGCMATVDLKF